MPSSVSEAKAENAPATAPGPTQHGSAPVRSMTGYARVRKDTKSGELAVSLRSVNHRGLDLHFHQQTEFAQFENAMRALLKQRLGRGHVEIRISLLKAVGTSTNLYNRDFLVQYLEAFRQASNDFQIPGEPDLNAAFRLPGIFQTEQNSQELDSSFEPELLLALAQCADELNQVREREGAELAGLLRNLNDAIERQTKRMVEIRQDVLPAFRHRLEQRLQELLGGTVVDPQRLAQEVAILADRTDIHEELARLEIHSRQLSELLTQGGEIGKRLDFLLQEMNREANTVLSKTSGIGEAGLLVTELALATKANIEKIREQALNLE